MAAPFTTAVPLGEKIVGVQKSDGSRPESVFARHPPRPFSAGRLCTFPVMNRIRVTAAVQYTTEIELHLHGGPADGAEVFVPLENGNVPPEVATAVAVQLPLGIVVVQSIYRLHEGCYHWLGDIVG